MRKWKYTVSSNNIWASFDGGTVEARTIQQAQIKAGAELQVQFDKANAALAANPETAGMTIEFNMGNIELELVKTYNHAMNISFTVLSDSDTNPDTGEILKGLLRAIELVKEDPNELLERTEVHDTFEVE